MNLIVWFKRLLGAPLPPNSTISSPEFTEMALVSQSIIDTSATITGEIRRIEAALRGPPRKRKV